MREIDRQRFWAKVNVRGPEECWPWLGATVRGQGVFTSRENTLRGEGPTAVYARRDTCAHGHPWTGEMRSDGGRRCRRCEADKQARYRARRKGV